MDNKNSNIAIPATAVVDATVVGTYTDSEAAVASDVTSLPNVATTTHVAVASMPRNAVNQTSDDNDDDDLKAKYSKYDYSHDDSYVVHDGTAGVAAIPQIPTTAGNTNGIPYNTPYVTPYNPYMDRLIAEEATRRGRILSEQEIQDIRHINYKAPAINNFEQQKVAVANQNALHQNHKEETGLTQTSATIIHEAVAVPTVAVATAEPEYFPGGTYGKGGYEISDYETNTYKTTDYKFTEYKSVYDP